MPVAPCRVTAIIPARDEADVIAVSIRSLLDQHFDGDLQVIVIDDNSSDGTGAVAHAAGVAVIQGSQLPTGWTGKLWAMQQGVAAAEPTAPDFFLFTDADIRHDSNSVASLVGLAQNGKFDLVSHMVKLHCKSIAEKLTIPAFVFFFFMLYPPAWIESRKRKGSGRGRRMRADSSSHAGSNRRLGRDTERTDRRLLAGEGRQEMRRKSVARLNNRHS